MQIRFLALLALLLGSLGPWCSRNTSPPNTSPPNTPPAAGGPLIPPDRLTTWNPGIPGGVPSRTTACATIDASTYDNGAKDAAAGIQAAIEACPEGQVVVLSAGTFAISVPLQITKGIVLRGQGPSQTKILMPVGTNAHLVTIGTQWFKFTQSTNLASDAAKGTSSAVLTNNPGLAAGEIVLVDQVTNPEGASFSVDASFLCIVRDSYVHSTQSPTPGGGGYGFSFSWYSEDNLLENNIAWNMNKVMVMRASGGGNVIAYNYMEDGWIAYTPGWVEVGLNASHMTTPHYELFEGNESFNFDGDNTWGNSVYITVFRNHLTAKRRSVAPLQLTDAQNARAIGLMEGHKWYSFVGNVLGSPDQSPAPSKSYTYEAPFPWREDPVGLWRLGYNPENWSAPPDKNVTGTVLREGNYDYATNQVRWGNGPQQLPASLYLASKPAFFGNSPWPWVDPTGATKLYTLPARARFDAMPH